MPAGTAGDLAAVVILATSSGIQPYREPYYARTLAEAGFAALIVDSFGARGVASVVEDQGALTSYQLEADAFGALLFLRGNHRIRRQAVALVGGSKGGTAALNSVFLIREYWRRTSARFAAHVAISPACEVTHRSVTTTGAPLLLLLAEHDDYAPAALCIDYAARIAETASAAVNVQEIAGASHGWERLGPLQWIPSAENFSRCGGVMEDDGRIMVTGEPTPLTSADYLVRARATCVFRGATVGGGSVEVRDEATARIIEFLRQALRSL